MARVKRAPGMTASEVLDLYSERAENGCLVWTRPLKDTGYGQVSFGGRPQNVHRLSWLTHRGPIPSGMTVDHKCHNEAAERGECGGGDDCAHRACLDPNHLRLESMGQNSRNCANTLAGRHLRRTHCTNGHEFTASNTYIRKDNGGRQCKQCRIDRRSRAREQGRRI